MIKSIFRLATFVLLTVFTQIGGLAFIVSLFFKWRLLAFVCFYAALTLSAKYVAPIAGRTALSCRGGDTLQVQSWFYCATNRNYVTTDLAEVLEDAANATAKAYPGTKTLVLDANFPFLTGFPLLPHLSHNDGEKADLAFFYKDQQGYLAGQTRSPIGYFAFEQGVTNCPKVWPTLRWDMGLVQWLWADYSAEPMRTRFLILALASDRRVGRILLEPHLKSSLGLNASKVRFQGCRAAGHDDHIHVQL